jgi:hypothetical protein
VHFKPHNSRKISNRHISGHQADDIAPHIRVSTRAANSKYSSYIETCWAVATHRNTRGPIHSPHVERVDHLRGFGLCKWLRTSFSTSSAQQPKLPTQTRNMVDVLSHWPTESGTRGTVALRMLFAGFCEGEQVEMPLKTDGGWLIVGDVKRSCFWSGVEAGAGATIPGRSSRYSHVQAHHATRLLSTIEL